VSQAFQGAKTKKESTGFLGRLKSCHRMTVYYSIVPDEFFDVAGVEEF